MAELLRIEKFRYMNAEIKYYDDNSEVFVSYFTPVVRKNPDGTYVRLWNSWSSSTSKQVKTWCGHSFRDIPFEDGTVEDRTVEYKRKGYNFHNRASAYIPEMWEQRAKNFSKSITEGLLYLTDDYYGYNTALYKELKGIYKTNKKYMFLFDVLNACINKKKVRGNNPINALLVIYQYDFLKVWLDGGLKAQYPELVAHI